MGNSKQYMEKAMEIMAAFGKKDKKEEPKKPEVEVDDMLELIFIAEFRNAVCGLGLI